VAAGLSAAVLSGVIGVSTIAPAASATVHSATPRAAAAATPQPAWAVKKKRASTLHFVVSSFNALGASHTKHSKRFAYGTHRIVWANQLLEKHNIDVVGFQELQVPQYDKFMEITGGAWAAYPGLEKKKLDSENSIAWRTDVWDRVDATTVNIPYFNGIARAMPVVLLRNKASNAMVYFANFHNPAETAQYKNQGHWRRLATNIEIQLTNQLKHTGIPRVMTGDMNERAPYFCRVTGAAPLKAARPTSYRKKGVCYANKPRAVDWVLGSLRFSFTNYDEDRSDLVDKTTDHPVISSEVSLDPTAARTLPNAWAASAPPALVPAHSWHER
jgi:hypothetical protein